MSEYKTLKGKRVKTFATDLDNKEAEGQIFFSTAAIGREFKTAVASAAWSSTAPMITARRLFASSSGNTQLAAWGAGGYVDGTGDQNSTEEYNGSGFSSSGNINTARREFDGAGTQTAGLIMGGRIGSSQQQAQTEEYDGSSWTSSNDLNTGRQR